MRLPRPVGPSQLSVSPVAMPQAPQAGVQLSGSDIWRVLRANALLIAVVVVGMLALGVVVNMWLAAKHPRYTATGLIKVFLDEEFQRPGEFRVSGPAAQNIEIEQHDQAARLKSPGLLSRVLEDSTKIRETQWFKDFYTMENGKLVPDISAAKEDLKEKFAVTPIPDSRFVSVGMTYSVPRDCSTIVEEIVNLYLKETSQSRVEQDLKHTQALDSMRQEYESEMKDKSRQISTLSKLIGSGGLSVLGPGSKDFELQALIAEQVRVEGEYNKAQREYDSFLDQLKGDGTPAIVEEMVQRSPAYAEDRRIADESEVQLEELESKLSKTHPLVLQLRTRMEAYQEKLSAVHEEIKTQSTASMKAALASMVEAAKVSVETVKKQIDTLRTEIADLAKSRNEYENLVIDQKMLGERLEKVKQEQEVYAGWAPGSGFSNAQWATWPEVPDKPTFPKLIITLGASLFLGLAISLGIAFLREITDTTVRSPRDIARVGQMNLLGMIPHESDDPQTAGARLPLAIFEAPHSIIAEQFRQVRTRLQHAASLDTTRSILVTGCGPEDGKSTVASNLAAGLALNGRRILLVDVNFRRPMLHNIFSLSNDVGFGDVLNAPELYEEAIRDTEVPNLSVLCSGNKPSNPTELLESQLLIDFIERALEEYDHVIFDSGPLLMVSETTALAPRVDGVITVVRANGNSRGLLQRVRDQLRQLKAEHLGVILNAVRVQGGGYYGPMIKNYYAYQNGNGSSIVPQQN